MSTLGIGVTNDSVTYEGETYRSGPNTTVTVHVNGNSVRPSEYVLQEGDRIRIVVEEN
jgi:sulfur carrier protein ThiS